MLEAFHSAEDGVRDVGVMLLLEASAATCLRLRTIVLLFSWHHLVNRFCVEHPTANAVMLYTGHALLVEPDIAGPIAENHGHVQDM